MNNLLNEITRKIEDLELKLESGLEKEKSISSELRLRQERNAEIRNKLNQFYNVFLAELEEYPDPDFGRSYKNKFKFYEKEKLSKKDFVINFVKQNSQTGVTPKQIIAAMEKANYEFTRNYIYSVIMRLKRGGLIFENNGFYFPG